MTGRAGSGTRARRTGAAHGPTNLIGAALIGAALIGAALIGAGCLAWAATPPAHQGWTGFALFVAIVAVAAGVLRLVLADVPVPEDNYLLPVPLRAGLRFLEILRQVPWEDGALVAILWLEVLHPARPWHTAVLGAGLIAYLLTTHLAESGTSFAALRPQVRVLAIGAALLALGAGAGMLPALSPGAGSALLRLLAAAALITAAGLVLPHVARGDAPDPGPPPDREPRIRRRRHIEPPATIRGSQIQPRDRR
jgi:MFS family permease